MADQLLIRVYDVGLGDCIYCRIPKAHKVGGRLDDFHMLIDCGSWSGMDLLKAALADLETMLSDAGEGKKRLDLVVVTHEHRDHIAGFDPELFADFKIGAIWMNTAMDQRHPQAAKTRALHRLAAQAMRSLVASGAALSPELEVLASSFGIDNDGAMEGLRTGLPQASGIVAKYVHAGMTHEDFGLSLDDAVIRVLGPEQDIDGYYLGKNADQSLRGLAGPTYADAPAPPATLLDATAEPTPPSNIGAADFRQLRARMLSSAFAFAELASKVKNNTSVVLLVEWKGKRLLFVGDAEWDTRFQEGKANGAWNVMWKERKALLDKPVDFLKIGHHGSENATPWKDGAAEGRASEPGDILDAILPLPRPGGRPTAKAVLSTERSKYKKIPRCELLVEVGRRVAGTRNYKELFGAKGFDVRSLSKFDDFEESWIDKPQPLRTDFERLLTGAKFIDVAIEA